MTFVPLGDRILVRPEKPPDKIGGVIIPDAAQDRPTVATVLAVGPGVRDQQGIVHEPGVVVGDRVVYMKFGGASVEVDGEDLLVLREGDIIGRYE